jgi:thiol-disulfide isomerase/thioredoxin
MHLRIFSVLLMFITHQLFSQTQEIPNSKLFPNGGGELILHEYLETLKDNEIAVLNFTSVSCIPCKKEIPELLRLSEKNPDMKLFIIFAESDPTKFAASLGVSKFYADPLGTLQNKYAIKGYPVTFIVSREKKVLARLDGYNEKNTKRLVALLGKEGK